jgi:hypothetical protein
MGAAKRSTKRSATSRKAATSRRGIQRAPASEPSKFAGAMNEEAAGGEDLDALGNDELLDDAEIDLGGDDEGGDDDLEGV